MPVKYPTADEVKQAFADAIPEGEPFDEERWSRLHRAQMNPTWEPASDGIEVLQAYGARLIRIQWSFAIDKMNTSSEANVRASAVDLGVRLSALANGEPTSFDAPKSEVISGPAEEVRCWTKGIIG